MATRGRGLLVLAMLVMAGCCSQDSPLLVQQREKQRSAVAAQQAAEASQSGLLRFRTQAQDGVLLRSELLQAECIDGVGGNGMARIDWEVSLPGVDRVRVSVVDGDQAKIWSEAGTVSGETTGAWLKQGLGFRFEATNDGRLLGQIDVIAQPCAGAP